ncbi:unnamed protein product, partial [Mycena citricolor]
CFFTIRMLCRSIFLARQCQPSRWTRGLKQDVSYRVISSLDPRHIQRSDYVVLSDLIFISFNLPYSSPPGEPSQTRTSVKTVYSARRTNGAREILPFPPQTRGFFYWDPCLDISHSGLAGGLKLRLSPSDDDPARAFAEGEDLRFPAPSDRVWIRTLPAVASRKAFVQLTSHLVNTGLVSAEDLDFFRRTFPEHTAISNRASFLYRLGQSFLLDLGQPKFTVNVISLGRRVVFPGIRSALYRAPTKNDIGNVPVPSCLVRVHYELLSTSSPFSSPNLTLGLRIESVVTPFIPHPTILIAPPVAGRFLHTWDPATHKAQVWSTRPREARQQVFEALLEEEVAHHASGGQALGL